MAFYYELVTVQFPQVCALGSNVRAHCGARRAHPWCRVPLEPTFTTVTDRSKRHKLSGIPRDAPSRSLLGGAPSVLPRLAVAANIVGSRKADVLAAGWVLVGGEFKYDALAAQ